MTQTKHTQNTYYFQGIRWIPEYRDFDFDDFTILAKTVEEAWKLLDTETSLKTWKSVSLNEINKTRYYESV
jgi:hypothetical protein